MRAVNFIWSQAGRWILGVAIGFVTLVLPASDACAWSVTNLSSRVVRARVLEGSWDVTLLPGASDGCSWWNIACNPSVTQNGVVSLKIETLAGDSLDFEVVVSMEADGSGVVRQETRPVVWSAPPNLYVSGYRANGTLMQVQPTGVGASSRQVRFLISADCQFCDLSDCHEPAMPTWNANAFTLNQHMIARMLQDPTLRGICYAGDLTQFASSQEWDGQYMLSVSGYTRFFYDGLGNHDLDTGRTRVRDAVTDRKRTTVKTVKGNPHYSWDWHDVHFVQLNLMPSDTAAPQFPDLDPMNALSFLIIDLATHVGTSQRPVVLIHHYGFDSFSYGPGTENQYWWTLPQRINYWNAIANYNVVGIFTGHLHSSASDASESGRFIRWDRPPGAVGGPESIPTFVSGTARDSAYLEVELNNADQLSVSLHDDTQVKATRCYAFGTPIWVDRVNAAPGYGWKDDPYPTVTEAINASSNRLSCISNVVNVVIKPGNYHEAVRITQPTRLAPDGGGTVHIGP
jgi:hypothetical protein